MAKLDRYVWRGCLRRSCSGRRKPARPTALCTPEHRGNDEDVRRYAPGAPRCPPSCVPRHPWRPARADSPTRPQVSIPARAWNRLVFSGPDRVDANLDTVAGYVAGEHAGRTEERCPCFWLDSAGTAVHFPRVVPRTTSSAIRERTRTVAFSVRVRRFDWLVRVNPLRDVSLLPAGFGALWPLTSSSRNSQQCLDFFATARIDSPQ